MKVTRMTVTPLSVPMDYPFQAPTGAGMNAINNPIIVQLYTDRRRCVRHLHVIQ